MQIVCKRLFTSVQNVHHLHGHMPGDAFCTGQLQCQPGIERVQACTC